MCKHQKKGLCEPVCKPFHQGDVSDVSGEIRCLSSYGTAMVVQYMLVSSMTLCHTQLRTCLSRRVLQVAFDVAVYRSILLAL